MKPIERLGTDNSRGLRTGIHEGYSLPLKLIRVAPSHLMPPSLKSKSREFARKSMYSEIVPRTLIRERRRLGVEDEKKQLPVQVVRMDVDEQGHVILYRQLVSC